MNYKQYFRKIIVMRPTIRQRLLLLLGRPISVDIRIIVPCEINKIGVFSNVGKTPLHDFSMECGQVKVDKRASNENG